MDADGDDAGIPRLATVRTGSAGVGVDGVDRLRGSIVVERRHAAEENHHDIDGFEPDVADREALADLLDQFKLAEGESDG